LQFLDERAADFLAHDRVEVARVGLQRLEMFLGGFLVRLRGVEQQAEMHRVRRQAPAGFGRRGDHRSIPRSRSRA
jgi:hypothetical protein